MLYTFNFHFIYVESKKESDGDNSVIFQHRCMMGVSQAMADQSNNTISSLEHEDMFPFQVPSSLPVFPWPTRQYTKNVLHAMQPTQSPMQPFTKEKL